jgi:anthranilate phosphoribosyltransferase
MKHVAPARSQLKIRTVFNILGPLANPAGARWQIIGVASPDIMDLMANALRGLDVDHAFVVHGSDGLDEVSVSGPTDMIEICDGEMKRYTITPGDLGITPAPREALIGGDATANAGIIEGVLRGDRGAHRDVVLMNSAVAIVVDSGAAMKTLSGLREVAK